jgi:Diguanylate cyclase, GGDEF domain
MVGRLKRSVRESLALRLPLDAQTLSLPFAVAHGVVLGGATGLAMAVGSRIAKRRREGTGTLLDIDHFKEFNDTLGHPAGDEVLHRVGSILNTVVRSHDVVARYGGEGISFADCTGKRAAEVPSRANSSRTWRVAHRVGDRQTSGVALVARHKETASDCPTEASTPR